MNEIAQSSFSTIYPCHKRVLFGDKQSIVKKKACKDKFGKKKCQKLKMKKKGMGCKKKSIEKKCKKTCGKCFECPKWVDSDPCCWCDYGGIICA